jgi:hypothetical protein
MIQYLAAIASAITLVITPIVVTAQPTSAKARKAEWTKPSNINGSIEAAQPIKISGATGPYVLSQVEQSIFRRALLRSVTLVHQGRIA